MKAVAEVKEELNMDLVKLGAKPDQNDGLKNVANLNKLLATTSDVFSPPEKVYGRGLFSNLLTGFKVLIDY